MKLPRDIDGRSLAGALGRLGYQVVRQRGSHIMLAFNVAGEHPIVIPDHQPLKPGTLNAVLRNVAEHHGLSRDEPLAKLKL